MQNQRSRAGDVEVEKWGERPDVVYRVVWETETEILRKFERFYDFWGFYGELTDFHVPRHDENQFSTVFKVLADRQVL